VKYNIATVMVLDKVSHTPIGRDKSTNENANLKLSGTNLTTTVSISYLSSSKSAYTNFQDKTPIPNIF